MKRFIVLLSLIMAFLNRLVDEIERRRAGRAERKQADEIERLRQDPVAWWQNEFGTDAVADDVRLPDAAEELTKTAKAAARDHAG